MIDSNTPLVCVLCSAQHTPQPLGRRQRKLSFSLRARPFLLLELSARGRAIYILQPKLAMLILPPESSQA